MREKDSKKAITSGGTIHRFLYQLRTQGIDTLQKIYFSSRIQICAARRGRLNRPTTATCPASAKSTPLNSCGLPKGREFVSCWVKVYVHAGIIVDCIMIEFFLRIFMTCFYNYCSKHINGTSCILWCTNHRQHTVRGTT